MSPHAMNVIYKLEDFNYLLAFARYDYVLSVSAKSPVKNMDDFIKWAKSSKEPLKYTALGMPGQIEAFQLAKQNGVVFAHVPFNTGPEGNTALVNGHIDFIISAYFSASPFVKSKEIRILATAAQTRLVPGAGRADAEGTGLPGYRRLFLYGHHCPGQGAPGPAGPPLQILPQGHG